MEKGTFAASADADRIAEKLQKERAILTQNALDSKSTSRARPQATEDANAKSSLFYRCKELEEELYGTRGVAEESTIICELKDFLKGVSLWQMSRKGEKKLGERVNGGARTNFWTLQMRSWYQAEAAAALDARRSRASPIRSKTISVQCCFS